MQGVVFYLAVIGFILSFYPEDPFVFHILEVDDIMRGILKLKAGV